MEQVAKIEQITADDLLINPDWIVDVKTHVDGYPCINLEDAMFFLEVKDYAIKNWQDYFVGETMIGLPLPKSKRA